MQFHSAEVFSQWLKLQGQTPGALSPFSRSLLILEQCDTSLFEGTADRPGSTAATGEEITKSNTTIAFDHSKDASIRCWLVVNDGADAMIDFRPTDTKDQPCMGTFVV